METAVRSTSIGVRLRLAFRNSVTCAGIAACGHQIGLQLIQFGLLRQRSVPEQEDDLFESGVLGQRVDVVSAVAEDARVSVDETDLGLARDDAFETGASGGDCCAHLFSFPVYSSRLFEQWLPESTDGAMSHDGERALVRADRIRRETDAVAALSTHNFSCRARFTSSVRITPLLQDSLSHECL